MEWFLIGMVLAVVLAWNRRRNAENATLEAAGKDAKQCPHCAEWVKAQAKICRYCGKDVPPAAPWGDSVGWAGTKFAKRPARVQYGMARTESVGAALAWGLGGFVVVFVLIMIMGVLGR